MQSVNRIGASSGRLLLVVGLHVVAIYLIATSLGIVKAPSFVEPMQATVVEITQPNEPMKTAEVKPELVDPNLDIPEPDTIPIPEVEVPVQVASESALKAAVAPVEATELAVSNRVAPVYPAISRRQGEQGVATFRILVDEHGRPLQVQVLKSSGFSRLDDAASQAIRKWTFVPPTKDGTPVRSWSRVQVRFQLETA